MKRERNFTFFKTRTGSIKTKIQNVFMAYTILPKSQHKSCLVERESTIVALQSQFSTVSTSLEGNSKLRNITAFSFGSTPSILNRTNCPISVLSTELLSLIQG